VIGDAVERLAGTMPDPTPDQLILLDLLRRLAAIVASPDTPRYAVAGAARELRAAAGELRALRSEDVGGEVEEFLGRIAAPDVGHAAD
jgi:hypothetical protein